MNLFSLGAILEALTPQFLFPRLSIARKMLLGYLMLVVLTLVVVIYALSSLHRLNNLNQDVIRIDAPVQEAADAMIDSVLAQDLYEKRSLIFNRRDVRSLLWNRGEEFDSKLAFLKSLPNSERYPIKKTGEASPAVQ